MKKLSEKTLYKGKWLLLKESTFLTDRGDYIAWESIERRRSRNVIVIMARLFPSDRIVLIRQYRPAIENQVIGFPAGIAATENIEEEALRELREETGYTGKVVDISPPLTVNSALLNDRLRLVVVDIDETDGRNANPKQTLESTEEISTFLVKRSEIREFLLKQQEQGYEIGSGLWYLFGVGNLWD